MVYCIICKDKCSLDSPKTVIPNYFNKKKKKPKKLKTLLSNDVIINIPFCRFLQQYPKETLSFLAMPLSFSPAGSAAVPFYNQQSPELSFPEVTGWWLWQCSGSIWDRNCAWRKQKGQCWRWKYGYGTQQWPIKNAGKSSLALSWSLIVYYSIFKHSADIYFSWAHIYIYHYRDWDYLHIPCSSCMHLHLNI